MLSEGILKEPVSVSNIGKRLKSPVPVMSESAFIKCRECGRGVHFVSGHIPVLNHIHSNSRRNHSGPIGWSVAIEREY